MTGCRSQVMLLAALAFALACGKKESPYYEHHYENQVPGGYAYTVTPDAMTESGIRVDTSGEPADLRDLDTQTDEVGRCLESHFGNPPVLPEAVIETAHCDSKTFPLPLIRADLVVKIAANWILSCDGTQQLLPSVPDSALCEAKGQTPTPECPCLWRAGIQDNSVIVVTPNLALYKDPLIRMVTGCNNPWVTILANCAQR